MALTTYTNLNYNNDAVTLTAIDTAVASAPSHRPSTLTPTPRQVITTTTDYGVGSTPTTRPSTFEPQSCIVSIDPGLAVSG